MYRTHEREKKRAYEQRVREVEHSSFTPLVLSATGGMGKEATTFFKRLASHLAEKWESHYSMTLGWLRCRLSFSLLHSAIQANRGARSSRGHHAAASHITAILMSSLLKPAFTLTTKQ
jgi:predicted exporter